ncbi:LacI family transcriptional regulator [Georgenia muralis]|uniref:LacI family transcriptional regulator n=1 Tax=Georgenia muralis TaxID=154117 RepID=A0A3N5A503_9MICO|nr:LacI family transcriptional regulator [Georgenia muralis]
MESLYPEQVRTTTLSDVAREAGVSLATASRAINGSTNRTVGPALRERVLAAAARLHYSPDANAQAMARGRTTSLGLIVHDIADPYFSAIAAGVTRAAEAAGLSVVLTSTEHDPAREVSFVELLRRQRVRAIVVTGGRRDDPEGTAALRAALEGFQAAGGSVALVSQPLEGMSTVVVDNREGAADLARHLHGIGYRRFAVVAGPVDHLTSRDRLSGFREALDELGAPLADGAVVHSGFTRDGGYEGMAELLRRDAGPEVVFAVNDVMAVGAMAAARDAGVSVPDDVAVAGFDDISTLRDITPALTTVRVPLVEAGVLATELALGPGEPREVHLAGEVVVRESTPAR